MALLSGLLYDPEEPGRFRQGALRIEDGRIVEVEDERKEGMREGIIIPTMVDAHTHLADGFICDPLPLDLDDAVSPPGGLKHKKLNNASDKKISASIASGLASLSLEGVGTVCDFREGGKKGLELARAAGYETPLELILLGRSEKTGEDLSMGNGIGLSSIVGREEEAVQISKMCRDNGKLFSFHHAEKEHEPLEPVLKAKPDFIVHGAHCTKEELEEMANHNIGAVVCPAMNALFGSVPPMREMLDAGMAVGLGTDNAMARPPSMLESMGMAYTLSRLVKKPLSPEEILDMAIIGGRKVLNLGEDIVFKEGQNASLAVFPLPSNCTEQNAANVLVNHARARDALHIQWGKVEWRASKGY